MTACGQRPATRATPTGESPAIETGTRGGAGTTAASRTEAATIGRAGTPTEATGAPEDPAVDVGTSGDDLGGLHADT